MHIAEILPSSIEIKYDCIKIDDLYISVITITKYDTNILMLDTMKDLIKAEEIDISFQIKRENNFEILKKLTNIIAQSNSEIGSVSKNQIDINEIDNFKSKALELRKKIQIDNEQVYMLSTYILIKAKDKETLLSNQKKYINMLYAKQIIAKPANFRQKEAYIANLPLLKNSPDISKYTHSIFTEQALTRLFPFFEDDVFNKEGIILGNANNNLCAIDVFSNKNNNYNMCIFGASGAGKSYFVKLMIIKNAYKGIRQIVIDPEGEYVDLVRNLGGHVYTSKNYNPFEINEAFLQNPDFFDLKVQEVINYLELLILRYKKIKGNIQLDKEKLKNLIIKAYNKYEISNTKDSLYKQSINDKVYIKPKFTTIFPKIQDLIELILKEYEELSKECDFEKIKENHIDMSLNNNNELYCFDLSKKSIKEIQEDMRVFMPKIYELIKDETLIYFDELWKIIGLGKDSYVIENIYNMFKTLRKKKAGIVAITQDVCDLFSLESGNFGKSILNNSNIKAFFKVEWQDVEMLDNMLPTLDINQKIKTLSRGNAYITMANTNFNLEVKATNYEHKLIEGEIYEKGINSNRK